MLLVLSSVDPDDILLKYWLDTYASLLLYNIFDHPLLSDITPTFVPFDSVPNFEYDVDGPLLTFSESVFTSFVSLIVLLLELLFELSELEDSLSKYLLDT